MPVSKKNRSGARRYSPEYGNVIREMAYYKGTIPDGYQLLEDSMPLRILDVKKSHSLREDTDGRNKHMPVMKVTGIYQLADEKNQNGRIYPEDVLKEAIDSISTAIKERRVLGELDHPLDAKIHMDRLCHLITRLWMDGKSVMGESEVFNDDRMPYGNQLAFMLERDIPVGISSRGVGDMDLVSEGGEESYMVQPGYQIVTFDAVAEPSVKTAQLRLMESVQKKQPRRPKRDTKRLQESLVAAEMFKALGIR